MFCPNCGREIPDGSKFCPYCGYKIAVPPEQKKLTKERREKTGRKKNSFLILIPIVAVVIVSGIFLYLKFFPIVNPEASTEHENTGITMSKEIVQSGKIEDNEKFNIMENEFKKAVKLNPDNVSARENLTACYILSDNFKEAEKEIEEILKRNPEDKYALTVKELLTKEIP